MSQVGRNPWLTAFIEALKDNQEKQMNLYFLSKDVDINCNHFKDPQIQGHLNVS